MCTLMLIPRVVYNMQVSRDAETGVSRGTAFVTMRSLAEAKTAINALDGLVSHAKPQLQLLFLSLYLKWSYPIPALSANVFCHMH